MKPKTLLLFVVCLAVCARSADAADWLQFRGPGGLGVAPDKRLPTTWSNTQNVVWKRQLPGPGGSSPIIVGKKIFVTCYSGYGVPDANGGDINDLKRHLICVDRATGKILWTRDVPADLPEQPYRSYQAQHGFASSTPVSDGERVYVFFGKSGVFAFDLDGKQVWHAGLGERTNGWGSGASPILYKGLVIINA